MALSTLGENGGVTKADKLAAFSKHPNSFFPSFLGDFARMVHISEDNGGVFPKVVGGTCVVWHLWDRNVSENGVAPHLLYEGVRSGDVLLVVGGPDMPQLCPDPVAHGDYGSDLEVFQKNVLELDYLFVGHVTGRREVEVAVAFLVSLLIEFRDPPSANQYYGVFGELFDFGARRQDKECW
jgi:hypothetical protein